jgi:hypothetical protein
MLPALVPSTQAHFPNEPNLVVLNAPTYVAVFLFTSWKAEDSKSLAPAAVIAVLCGRGQGAREIRN